MEKLFIIKGDIKEFKQPKKYTSLSKIYKILCLL